jgi:hypothetical protein
MHKGNYPLLKIWLFFPIIYSLIFFPQAYGQSTTVQPTPTQGNNSLSFDSRTNTYNFYLNGNLCYSYTVLPGTTTNGGSFNVLRDYADNGTSFLPSNFGGVSAILGGANRFPFDKGISFICLNHQILPGDTLSAHWKMIYNNADYIQYEYKFKIEGRTLIIKVKVDSAYSQKVTLLNMDRCEGAKNPIAIAIPYLPLFNVLFANNEFTSFYTDWNVTNASQIIPTGGSKYSNSSIRYAQQILYKKKTDGSRNRLSETLYLTTSPNIDDVFPSVPNPVSAYKQESAKLIVWDFRPRFDELVKPSSQDFMDKIYDAGVRNIWLQIHNWQANHGAGASYMSYSGYDDDLPCVLPANRYYGGNAMLESIITKAQSYGYYVGLHENYVDYYVNSAGCSAGPGYSESDVALNSDGSKVKAFKNNNYKGEQSYLLKPSRASYYADKWSSLIQATFPGLYGCYLDVHSSVNPSDRIDYDASISSAGMFRGTMNEYRNLYSILRNNQKGPVEGEGGMQLLYQGYGDDFEARLITPSGYKPGYEFPVLIDFDMLKLHDKAFVHGVGFYPFFYTRDTVNVQPVSRDIVLSYIATELAYGHGGYLPTPELTFNMIEHAKLEYKYVFSVQTDYANAQPAKILYNDNDSLKTASEYIKSHPDSYNDISSENFMGQVEVIYNNGVIVCVNRNSLRPWEINIGKSNGWFDYNANNNLYTGTSQTTEFTLPPKNGWVVYDPLK